MPRFRLALLVLASTPLAAEGPAPAPVDPAAGVVVESAHPEGAAAAAGIRPGDRLVAWRREASDTAPAAGGPVGDAVEWVRIQLEEAPRGPLHLELERGGSPSKARVVPGEWLLEVRPTLDEDGLRELRRARERLAATPDGDEDDVVSPFLRLSAAARARGEPATATALALLGARELVEAGHAGAGRTLLEAALHETTDPLPSSLLHDALGDLLIRWLSDVDGAEVHYRRALELHRARAGEGLATAAAWNDLSYASLRRDDLHVTEERVGRFAELVDRMAPGSSTQGEALSNRGYMAWLQGDYVTAEQWYRRALNVQTPLGRAGRTTNLLMLGLIASSRGDLETAEEFARRSVELRRAVGDDPLTVATGLTNLAGILQRRGELEEARSTMTESLEIRRRWAPGSLDLAGSLQGLGRLEVELGRLDRGEERIAEALAIQERLSPGGLTVASSHQLLGEIALDRGRLKEATRLFESALELRRQWAPGSPAEARSRHFLGRVWRLRERSDLALEHLLAALETLEEHRLRLGGSVRNRTEASAERSPLVWEAVDLLVREGRAAEAFEVHERGHARAFLDSLAERRIDWHASLSPELARKRREAIDSYEASLAALARLDAGSGEDEVAGARRAVRSSRREILAVEDQVRAAAPRYAALRYPHPLSLEDARAVIGEDLLLSFSVGADATFLFALGPGDRFTTHRLPLGRAALERDVQEILDLLGRPSARTVSALHSRSRRLAEVILGPVVDALRATDRILIAPDGPLHFLPFSILPVPGTGGQSIVDRAATSFTPSITATTALRAGGSPASERLVAFADPAHPGPGSGEEPTAAVRSLERLGSPFSPLAAARREVEQLATLWPGSTQIFVGAEATESRAKALESSRILHFACHAVIDTENPMESGLLLTPDDGERGENGLLQVWEIYDEVRLRAELVTLSACETARGRQLGGEGVLGFTRAFHFAGARNVLATLWQVADVSTALLMERFYVHLEQGLAADEALRRAQLELREAPLDVGDGSGRTFDARHPYYWAGFQISGG